MPKAKCSHGCRANLQRVLDVLDRFQDFVEERNHNEFVLILVTIARHHPKLIDKTTTIRAYLADLVFSHGNTRSPEATELRLAIVKLLRVVLRSL